MTRTPSHSGSAFSFPDGDDMAHLDPDLRSLASSLNTLGASDRAAAAPGLEDRLMQSTLAALHGVEAVAAQAADLGAADRAAAPADLESTVLAGSLPALRDSIPLTTPVLRHVGQPIRSEARQSHARRAWFSSPFMRVAALVALVAGAAIAVQMGMPKAAATPDLERVKGDMDTLFAAMESRPSSDSTDSTDTQSDDLTNWLFEGAAS